MVEYLLRNLTAKVRAPPVLKYFSVTPPENSGGAENSTESSGPHAKNFFCSMYESSLRHQVWVPEINVNPCNSVAGLKLDCFKFYYCEKSENLHSSSLIC